MTETVTDSGRDQRITERVEQLYANDPQFRAAASLPEVTDAANARDCGWPRSSTSI